MCAAAARDEIANEGEKNEREAKKESLEKFLTVEWLRTSIKYSTAHTKECPDRFPRKVYRKKIMLFFF